MPTSRKTTKAAMAAAAAMPSIPKELIDQFVTGPMSAQAVNAASMAFKKALIERALGAELSHHLGYRPGATKPEDAVNHRNGASGKTVLTEDGPLRIDVPRDREGSFEPMLIPKHDRRFTGFDDKIVAMYARGMTVREIQGFLAEQYGTEVAPDFISSVTDAVMAEVGAWQARPLEPMYPVVFFDALRVKIREDAVVRNKAIYLALGSRLRKIIKTRGHFPSDDAASKLIWLALRNITADWSRAAKEWKLAMNQFAILFEERFTQVAHGAGR
jgi:transposase-like protein